MSAENRPNIHVLKYGSVENVSLNKQNRTIGVVYKRRDKTIKSYARREVIMSGGSIMTPMVLMLSGIGPAKHLKNRKILLRMDLPVGRNLLNHIYTIIFFQLNSNTNWSISRFWYHFQFSHSQYRRFAQCWHFDIECRTLTKLPNFQIFNWCIFWFWQNSPNMPACIKTCQLN